MGLWPTQGEEKRLLGAQSLPFVIPTGAQRSGGTCGSGPYVEMSSFIGVKE
jgi:hypothetical protein